MSLKSLIKVANYYNIKYSFDKLGQVKKIDPEYQKVINRILEAYNLGKEINPDGWWGGETARALSAIQDHFNLNPFTDSKESLDQLYTIQRTSAFTPVTGKYNQMANEFLAMVNNFKKYITLNYEKQSKWESPELIVDFFEGIQSYLDNILSYSNSLKALNLPEINNFISSIVAAAQEGKERIVQRLALAKQLQTAQETNKKPIIDQMVELEKKKQGGLLVSLVDNANNIRKEIFESYSASGQYIPEEL